MCAYFFGRAVGVNGGHFYLFVHTSQKYQLVSSSVSLAFVFNTYSVSVARSNRLNDNPTHIEGHSSFTAMHLYQADKALKLLNTLFSIVTTTMNSY